MTGEDEQARAIAKAMKAAVAAIGGAKEVGVMLWPQKDIDDADGLVNDCINPNRREKFSLIELVQIMSAARKAGNHDVMHALERACGYSLSRSAGPTVAAPLTGEAVVPSLLAAMLEVLQSIDGRSTSIDETLRQFAEKYA